MLDVYRKVIRCLIRDVIYFTIRRIIKGNTVKPMMFTKEEDMVLEILKKKNPKRCLEWGAGYSTICFPQYLREDAKWISIEHNKEWFERINHWTKDDSTIECYHVPPNNSSWKDNSYSDGDFLDFEDYIKFPTKFNKKYDFILIDGRARKFCLRSALEFLEPDGIVVLHDANRNEYNDPFILFNHQILFTDARLYSGGLWIGSKSANLGNFLDIYKHRLVWKILARFFPPLTWSPWSSKQKVEKS